jgi:hypothetical protein
MFSSYDRHLIPSRDPDKNGGDGLSAVFLHQRCVCRIIILIVKSGLKQYVDDFRISITFLNALINVLLLIGSIVFSVGVNHCKFGESIDVRWNSTYLMLKHLVP